MQGLGASIGPVADVAAEYLFRAPGLPLRKRALDACQNVVFLGHGHIVPTTSVDIKPAAHIVTAVVRASPAKGKEPRHYSWALGSNVRPSNHLHIRRLERPA
jgi:hypothetical protein